MKTPLKRIAYYVGLGLISLVMLSGLFTFALPQQEALAATGSWVNNETIRYNGRDYKGPTVEDGNYRYTATSAYGAAPCTGKGFIEFGQNPTEANTPTSPGFIDEMGANGLSDDGITPACTWVRNTRIDINNGTNAKKNETQANCASLPADRAEGCVRQAAQTACEGITAADRHDQCVAAFIAREAAPNSGAI
ncbi:MAG: hypothetical protein JWP13_835, partial [Candidatus Saccharibacteria bacterium]|nr:hypothetical protein [Candidatus Saccharibacteria bacterium]